MMEIFDIAIHMIDDVLGIRIPYNLAKEIVQYYVSCAAYVNNPRPCGT